MMLKIHYLSYIMVRYLSKLRRLCAFPNTIQYISVKGRTNYELYL